MIKRSVILLLGIILLATVLRLWQFGTIPQGFQIDEAAFGYNAYSLMMTGKDEFGTLLPVTLRSFDDYKAALYSYATIPFILIFGLNEVSTRMPSAVIGILFVILSFLLTRKLTKNENLALIVAFLTAISPTFIFLSRVQSDPILAVFFVVLGVYSFIKWVEDKKSFFLFGSFILFALSMISYQSPRVLLLFLIPFLVFHYREKIDKRNRIVLGGFVVLIFLLVGYLTFSGGARYKQTGIFTTPDIQLLLEESIRSSDSPVIITRIFNNKPVYFGRALIENYFSYFDFDFLFFQAESPVREKVKHTGFLYLIELPFLLLGIFQILRRKIRWGYFLIGWVIITPLVLSPFIYESPNIHRFLLALVPLLILIGYGITEFFEIIKKNRLIYNASFLVLSALFFVSLLYFWYQLFVHQPVYRPWARNHPYKELLAELKSLEPRYRKIVVTTSEANTYMFYLFYNKYDPKAYQESGSRGNENNATLGKYFFDHDACPITAGKEGLDPLVAEKNVLYVNSGNCKTPAKNVKLIKEIKWGDDSTAFTLIEYTP